MSDLSKLEAMYEKECNLTQVHKEKAEALKQRIDQEKSQAIIKSVRKISLSPEEFKILQKALENEENVKKILQQMGGNKTADGTADRAANTTTDKAADGAANRAADGMADRAADEAEREAGE